MTAAVNKTAPEPAWIEEDRLAALRSYGILDTPPEPAFDEITRVAALVCKAPIAVVNLIEDTRQFFKSKIGLGVRETPVDVSICAHAILQRDLFVVPDTTKDPRFACNPLVTGEPNLRFYAGALLETPEGLPLGTVCVLDYEPRPDGITHEQAEVLRALARAAMAQMELRRSNTALAQSEGKFRAITDSVDQMIWSTRPDGYHDFYNQRWYDYTGVPEGSTDGEAWNGMFHPDDQEQAWARWRHSLSTGEPYQIEYRLRHRSGEYRWVLGRAQPMLDQQGRVTRWFGTCTDIHDLKQAEAALRESEERFRTLTEAMPALVFSCDRHGHNDYTNQQYQRFTGLTADELLGDGWFRALHPKDHARTMQVWEDARQSGQPYEVEYRLRRADGAYRWFLGRAIPLHSSRGRVERWLGAAIDIHDRKQGERANAHLAAIVSSSPDAVISFAPEDGHVLTWNRGAEDTFGYTADEAIGAPVDLLLPQGALTQAEDGTGVFGAAMAQGDVRLESRRRCKDGRIIHVSVTATQMKDEQGKVLGVSGIFRDITERKRAEERQHLLTRELHHRIKNTLATIQAIAGSTARSVSSIEEFSTRFADRLISMGRTHTLVTENAWKGASLRDLLRLELDPYDDGSKGRIRMVGPEVYLSADTALALGLGFHELTTNAAKHGALSISGGQVEITWTTHLQGSVENLRLTWVERSGPPVSLPSRRGFGSQLLQRVLGTQVDGSVDVVYDPAGLQVQIDLPLKI